MISAMPLHVKTTERLQKEARTEDQKRVRFFRLGSVLSDGNCRIGWMDLKSRQQLHLL
jgi:hypothetical protein